MLMMTSFNKPNGRYFGALSVPFQSGNTCDWDGQGIERSTSGLGPMMMGYGMRRHVDDSGTFCG
jgi:hypothetical protein